jgi:hypothetical membrane protein
MLLLILVLVLVFGGGGGFTVIAVGDMAGERALDWGLYLLILLVAYLLGVFHKQEPRHVPLSLFGICNR